MPSSDSVPTDALSRAIDEAIRGRPAALHSLLARGSHLPGPRANTALAEAFAHECRRRGAAADPLALSLSRLSPAEAPGATALEFLPVCGVHAIGARAASDPLVRVAFLSELHARADDVRFRVRDAVVLSLSRMGQATGEALVADVAAWMDGYFHAAAVLRALQAEAWLGAVRQPDGILLRFDDSFTLIQNAPRAAARWPGHKELVLAIVETPVAVALRFGVPVFDWLARWTTATEPDIRDAIEHILDARKLARRFSADAARVRAALDAGRKPVRNPDHDFGPTRDRSGHRRRRRSTA